MFHPTLLSFALKLEATTYAGLRPHLACRLFLQALHPSQSKMRQEEQARAWRLTTQGGTFLLLTTA